MADGGMENASNRCFCLAAVNHTAAEATLEMLTESLKNGEDGKQSKFSAAFLEIAELNDSLSHLNDAEFTQALKTELYKKIDLMDDAGILVLLVYAAERSPRLPNIVLKIE